MRLFQNAGLYKSYKEKFNSLNGTQLSFESRIDRYIADRFNAVHLLKPVLERQREVFFTNGDDKHLQYAWAVENGLNIKKLTIEDILMAQVEYHQSEVFYNLDPLRFSSSFVKKLPGCVKRKICWRAAPSPGADLSGYDLVVCNFPSILSQWKSLGWGAAYMTPAHDPVMDIYGIQVNRPIDILFIGGFSRHHKKRALILEAVAALSNEYNICYLMDESFLTRIAESPVGYLPGLSTYKRPSNVISISSPPVFGIEMYKKISQAKIVLNGAIDMSGLDRGNMRCFETLGCGALMLSDEGHYPDGFRNQTTMLNYYDIDDVVSKIHSVLGGWNDFSHIAHQGFEMVRTKYSKSAQWELFTSLL